MALIVPEVYAELVREKYEGRSVMRHLSEDLGTIQNTTVGGTVVFPQWSTITDAEDMTDFTVETDRLTAVKLAQTSVNAPVKQYGKAIYVRDLEDVTALGNQINEAAYQTGAVIARKVDSDLFTEALSTTNPIVTTTAMPTDADFMSLFNTFGDDQDIDTIAGLVINSAIIPAFLNSNLFVDATTTTAAAFIGNGIVRNGLLGFYRGVPVYLSDKETQRTKGTYTTLLLKKNAIAYMEKRGINVEEDRQAMSGGSNIVSNLIFACKLVRVADVAVMNSTF